MDELNYIKDAARFMADRAEQSGFVFLAYLLRMVAEEARDQHDRERLSRERMPADS